MRFVLVSVVVAGSVTLAVEAGGPGSASVRPSEGRLGPSLSADSGEVAVLAEAEAGPAFGTYDWPVVGPVIRGFEPPPSPFAPGHRGIDIGVPIGTPIRAPADGVVAFAGPVAGSLFVSIDHPDGVRTTYSWLSGVAVRRGEAVRRGAAIGATGAGHPGSGRPHLHFGARVGETYIDPMLLLGRGSLVGLVRLAPLERGTEGGEGSGH